MSAEQTRRAEEFSQQLRRGTGEFLPQRRGIAALSLITVGSMSLISLSQMGIIKHLPEPPLPLLDADKVDASAEASSRFSTPDALLGISNLLEKDTTLEALLKVWAGYVAVGVEGVADRLMALAALPAPRRAIFLSLRQAGEGSGSQEPQTEQMRLCLDRWLALAFEFE